MAIGFRDFGGRGGSLLKKKTATERAIERAGETAREGQFKVALGQVACPGCGSMIDISRWNSERVMCICNNMTCGLWHRPMSDFSVHELLSSGPGH